MVTSNSTFRSLQALGLAAMAWLVSLALLGSRSYSLLPYATSTLLSPPLEPLGATSGLLLVCLLLAIGWLWMARHCARPGRAIFFLLLASLPTASWGLRLSGFQQATPVFVEVMWLACWSGLSFGELALRNGRWSDGGPSLTLRVGVALLMGLVVLLSCWWFYQAWWYHNSFLFGFNDYGHFLQRIVNTLSGQGLLLETPVLPAFWDHFNPGLLLLAPLWLLWPDVHQAFVWQAVALAGSAYLVYRIALKLDLAPMPAALFGIAWLVQPVIGQMNLAFSYGWHPITLAIPLLLASIWSLLSQRYIVAAVLCVLALSMEEGVFVVVSLTALVCGAWQWTTARGLLSLNESTSALERYMRALSATTWIAIGMATAAAFVLIYRLSGLAEFQTGRFVALGSNLPEVLMSPILRPSAFWGSLLNWDRWYYLLLLWLPCGLPALARGWPYLIPTCLPLGVLMVWDHAPAHSITFQYPSTLLPLFWLAAISGVSESAAPEQRGMKEALTAFATGLVLSLFIGQLPFSSPTLLDVDARTYGVQSLERRRLGEEDGQWLTEQVQQIRQRKLRCLATGRIAAHLVGMPDIETVGQYIERRPKLANLPDRLGQPIKHYEVIMLDRQESFQQSPAQIEAIEAEARAAGFVEQTTKFNIVVLVRMVK